MGADKAVRLSDEALHGTNAPATAKALAKVIGTVEGVELVIAGNEATDGRSSAVPAMVAEGGSTCCPAGARRSSPTGCAHIPGVEIICRDGSATYAQAVRDALPDAVQVADRWHLWHGLAEAAGKEVAAHICWWAGATGTREGPLAETTFQR